MEISIVAKCNDLCSVKVPELSVGHFGCVPRGLGIGGGDYIRLVVDTTTGRIDGWVPLSEEDLKDILSEQR